MADEVTPRRSLTVRRLYEARIAYVSTYVKIDATVFTDFRVSFTHRCVLHNVPRVKDSNPERLETLKKATVMLIGGVQCLVETVEPDTPQHPNLPSVIVYRRGIVSAQDCNLGIDNVDYVDVNRYLRWLMSQPRLDLSIVAKDRRALR